MKSKWKNEDIRQLFELVERNNAQNKSTMQSFKEFAKLQGKNALSVRNFYYCYLKLLKSDENLQKKLQIDVSKHNTQQFEHFDDMSEKKLKSDVEKFTSKGLSIRSACLSLSGGDVKKMLRLQNKYRSIVAKQQKKVQIFGQFGTKNNSIAKNFKSDNDGTKKVASQSTVYQFPSQKAKSRQKLSDDDIKSLFLGLVNLVKENARQDNREKFEQFLEQSEENKRKQLIVLEQKQLEIESLTRSVAELKQKNFCLNKKLEEYRIQFVSNNQKPTNRV